MAGTKNSGRRPGRPCDWFLERCREILDEEKLLDFVGGVASGRETEQRVTVVREGNEARIEIVEVKCSTQDRLSAFKMLAEWGVGKPVSLEVTQLVPVVQNLINEQAMLKLLYARNFADAGRVGSINQAVVAGGPSSLQARTTPA